MHRILIVEDEEAIRAGLLDLLEIASSSLVFLPAEAAIDPEMSMPMTSARLARRRSCLRSKETGETSSSEVLE
jgi:hypothetical protein